MEEKKIKTMEDLNIEYQKACFKAGTLQYQIYVLKRDLELTNELIRDLNIAGAELQAKAKKEEAPNAQAAS